MGRRKGAEGALLRIMKEDRRRPKLSLNYCYTVGSRVRVTTQNVAEKDKAHQMTPDQYFHEWSVLTRRGMGVRIVDVTQSPDLVRIVSQG